MVVSENVPKCNKMASFAQSISSTMVLSRMTNFVQKALLFIVCVGLVWHYFDAGLVRPRPILFSKFATGTKTTIHEKGSRIQVSC